MVYPVESGGSVTLRQTPDINQADVDLAVRKAHTGNLARSPVADALRDPNLNSAERDKVIQTLARDKTMQYAFFGNEGTRWRNENYAALSEDQRVIADAVQSAYESGAINADDLVQLADVPN